MNAICVRVGRHSYRIAQPRDAATRVTETVARIKYQLSANARPSAWSATPRGRLFPVILSLQRRTGIESAGIESEQPIASALAQRLGGERGSSVDWRRQATRRLFSDDGN